MLLCIQVFKVQHSMAYLAALTHIELQVQLPQLPEALHRWQGTAAGAARLKHCLATP